MAKMLPRLINRTLALAGGALAAAATVLQLVSSAGMALTLWMLATLLAARRTSARPLRALVAFVSVTARFAAGHATRFAPRPPPLRA